jgi:nitrilase
MYAKGIEIFCAPSDYPQSYSTSFGDDPDTVLSRGGSCIVGPLGRVLAGPDFNGETILTAEIDRADIAGAKLDFDAVRHYARPDVFRLVVDEAARTPVEFVARAEPES